MDTSGEGYTSPQSHVTQGQQSQGFGHVNPAGQVTQVPLSPGGGESWPGYPGPEAPPALYLEPQVTSPKTFADYRQRASTVLGAVQITAALVSIILNIAGIMIWDDIIARPYDPDYYTTYSVTAYGICCSLFYMVSGSLAIQAGKRARRGVVIASTVMSTISAVLVWLHIGLAITGIDGGVTHLPTSFAKINLGLDSVLLIFGIIEFIVTVWTASLGCVVTCCGSQATKVVTQTKVVFVPSPQQHSGHDWNTQRLVPGNLSAYPTYSISSPEAVYNTIPDHLPEVRGQSMSRDTTDVYLTTDHSSPAGRHHYIQVFDQPDVCGVPPSSDGVYPQPKPHINPPEGVDMSLTTSTATLGNR